MTQLVRLVTRPSRDGKRYTYCLDYKDENGKRVRKSLGHADKRKAERQRAQLEREIRMGTVAPGSLTISEFVEDSLLRTGDQIRLSTVKEYQSVMKRFISIVGNIDIQQITLKHGEAYVQTLLDEDKSPDTIAKHVRTLKRFFNLAVERDQMEINPLRFLKPPKRMRRNVRVYTPQQCERLLKVAKQWPDRSGVRWDILIYMALTTGLRKGELLNLIWTDIDFEHQIAAVTPKKDSISTWRWDIKDSDERTVPLIDEVVNLLTEHQAMQPAGHPYVFVPPNRYNAIQRSRQSGIWDTDDARCNIIGNFSKHFQQIVRRSGIQTRMTFHDLRRTCLSDWLSSGMGIHDVMTLAGHAKITTTQSFYISVSDDLLTRARTAKGNSISPDLAHICHAPH